jgi:basic membrane lipoprotein Med (substrate-binding protein (PBP1-ABC) superfamily)
LDAGLVLAHGGQHKEALRRIAACFYRQRFVIAQARVTGGNLARYQVLQEEPAPLARMWAALMTCAGVMVLVASLCCSACVLS